jgi:hypothetical protein
LQNEHVKREGSISVYTSRNEHFCRHYFLQEHALMARLLGDIKQ